MMQTGRGLGAFLIVLAAAVFLVFSGIAPGGVVRGQQPQPTSTRPPVQPIPTDTPVVPTPTPTPTLSPTSRPNPTSPPPTAVPPTAVPPSPTPEAILPQSGGSTPFSRVTVLLIVGAALAGGGVMLLQAQSLRRTSRADGGRLRS